MFPKALKTVFPIFFITLLVLFYFWPNLAGGMVTYPVDDAIDDLTEMHYPLRHLLIQKITQGSLPIWTDKTYTGFPMIAQGEMGAFYPPNIIFSLFLPTHLSIWASIAFVFFGAGIGTYWYLKKIGLSSHGSLFGATVFAFSGFFMSHQVHINHVATAMWLPFALATAEEFIRKGKLSSMLILGAIFALGQLAGGNQLLFYMILFVLSYSAFLKPKSLTWPKFFTGWALAGLFTLGLSAIQVLPTVELIRFSNRASGMGTQASGFLSFPFHFVLNFFLPYLVHKEGNTGWFFFERFVYFGWLPWIFAVAGVLAYFQNRLEFFNKKNKYVIFYCCSAIITLLLAFGDQTFLKFVYSLPGFNFFRIPSKFLVYTQFSVIILSAVGCHYFGQRLKLAKSSVRKYVSLILIVIILAAFTDIYLNDRLHVKYSAAEWFKTPQTVEYIKKKQSQDRIIWLGMTAFSEPIKREQPELYGQPQVFINLHNLLPNLDNLLFDIPTSSGYSGGMGISEISRVNELLIWMDQQIMQPEPVLVTDNFLKIARLTNSRYLLVGKDLQQRNGIKQVFTTNFSTGQKDVRVWEIDNPLPRAYLVDKIKTVKSHNDAYPLLIDNNFQPEKEVIVENPIPDNFLSPNPKLQQQVRITGSLDTQVDLKTESNKNSVLFMSDTFYPGWNVYLDGKKGEILRANYAFRAVLVPSGNHTVSFRYEPQSVIRGIYISLASIIIVLILIPILLIFDKSKYQISNI